LSKWLQERKNDYYHKKAKQKGYRSRAAYKLKQINNKFKVFESAKYVLDLGAAPGGWLQVVNNEIEEEDSLIIGVDIEEIIPIQSKNIVTIKGDITKPETYQKIINIFRGKIDVVLSDMAPNIIGEWDFDQYRQIHLARNALHIAYKLLKKDGWFITKVFMGSEHDKFIKEVKELFEIVKNFKPKASRKESAERYIVAKNLKETKNLESEEEVF
jgi:23S rRNA (uridine2552-2'-O)-methyltransferase